MGQENSVEARSAAEQENRIAEQQLLQRLERLEMESRVRRQREVEKGYVYVGEGDER
jgi:hypothetical protein